MEAPEYVTSVHERFIAAGSEIVTTNSYAVVPYHIGESAFLSRGEELAKLAGNLAKQAAKAAPTPVLVAASLPPVCGSYRADLFHPEKARPILSVLVKALRPSADIWLGETLSTIREARVMVGVLRELGATAPLWLSFTVLDDEIDLQYPARLRSGELVKDVVSEALDLGASAILFNCSAPEAMGRAIKDALEVVREASSTARVGAYANSFPASVPNNAANSTVHSLREDLTPAIYTEFVKQWVAMGASIVGGCCGIGAEHIADIKISLNL